MLENQRLSNRAQMLRLSKKVRIIVKSKMSKFQFYKKIRVTVVLHFLFVRRAFISRNIDARNHREASLDLPEW